MALRLCSVDYLQAGDKENMLKPLTINVNPIISIETLINLLIF